MEECCLKLDSNFCESDDYRIEHNDYDYEGYACIDCYFIWLGRILKKELFYKNNKKLNCKKLEKIQSVVFETK